MSLRGLETIIEKREGVDERVDQGSEIYSGYTSTESLQ